MRRLGLHIHWAWVPAATLGVVTAYLRDGWAGTTALVILGLALAALAEWRARRRRRESIE